jgi:Glycosyl hydrolase catalytic core
VKRFLPALALTATLAGLVPAAAHPARHMLVGMFDESETLGYTDRSMPALKTLRVQIIRSTLYWGGKGGVAGTRRPAHPTDPADKAYNWAPYDRMVREAAKNRIKVLFSIWGTPSWANKGKGLAHAPTLTRDLRNFAYAATKRYSGTYVPVEPAASGTTTTTTTPSDDKALPAVRNWLAWNEPNNPLFLQPQYKRVGTGKRARWVAQATTDYAHICNAVYAGVHATLIRAEKVACGGTAPRGNNNPKAKRASIGPIPFLKGVKRAHLAKFDAWAHHPYYASPSEKPSSVPTSNRGKRGLIAPPVVLGNINDLIKEVTRLYGKKRIWITEYGYQTNPPDRAFGVSWAKQALYLKQAYAIARKNPRIDMMLWFLLRDQKQLGGWQSGLMTYAGKKKPSFNAYRTLPH